MDTPRKSKAKVLIVDDQSEMRDFLRDVLEMLPVDILEAGDGLTAMNLIEAEQPDLLLSDYHMPNWDGLTLCHQLRGPAKNQDPAMKIVASLKIVLITGETTEPVLLQAVNHGIVDAAFHKPVDAHELTRVIKRLLAFD